jgi:hypothetical protein
MKKIIKAAAVLAIILSVSGLAGAQDGAKKPASGSWDARLYNIRGKVFIQPAGGGKKWIAVTRGMPLMQGDRIGTGKNSKVDVSLDDSGVVTVSESSAILLKDLRRKDASFLVNVGRIFLKIPGLKKRMEALQVRTPAAVAAVRGTEFGVSYDTITAESEVNVFDEGLVRVVSLDEDGDPVGDGVMLGPRHEVRVKKDMAALKPSEMSEVKARNPDMANARKGLLDLKKNYVPINEQDRLNMRQDALTGAGVDSISSSGRGPQKAGEAQDRGGQARNGERGAKSGQGEYGPAGAENKRKAADSRGTAAASKAGSRSADEASTAGKKQDEDTGLDKSLGASRSKQKPGDDGDGIRKKGFEKDGTGDDGKTRMTGVAESSLGDKTATINTLGNTATTKKVDTIVGSLQDRLAATGNSDLISRDELNTMVRSEMKDSPSQAVLNQRLTADLAARLSANQDSGMVQSGSQLQTGSQLQAGSQIQSGFTPMTNMNAAATKTNVAVPAANVTKKLVVH